MAAKFNLVPEPKFPGVVKIPLADGKHAEVRMTFKHRTRVELAGFLRSLRTPDPAPEGDQPAERDPNEGLEQDVDLFLQMVDGWELEDEFTRDNVRTLLNNYYGAWFATYNAYLEALHRATLGN